MRNCLPGFERCEPVKSKKNRSSSTGFCLYNDYVTNGDSQFSPLSQVPVNKFIQAYYPGVCHAGVLALYGLKSGLVLLSGCEGFK